MKSKAPDLAVLGGSSAFDRPLYVGRPNIGNRASFLARVNDMLDRRWLTNQGPYVHEFEEKIASYLGVKHCVAMCNGTIALEIAIRALGMKGEVIVPSFTFVATAHALQWQEITPVFCDIDPNTFCIDAAKAQRLLTPRTTGIIGVHVWGRTCDREALEDFARRHGLKLLYDAAHAIGCSHRGRMVGGFGDAEVFSFHATKFFNTFEGGAVVTNDDDLAQKIRLMQNFGFRGEDKVIYIGTNGKMTEICAAMGLTSLESIDAFIEANRENYQTYRAGLRGIHGASLVEFDEEERNNYQYVVLLIDENEAGISRDQLQKVLVAENVMARRYFFPGCHQMEPYRSYYPNAGLLLPVTERVCAQALCLPTGTCVSREDADVICGLVRFAVENAPVVRSQLGG